MSAVAHGPAGGLTAGYARVRAGTRLLRGHTPGRRPDFFGPDLGRPGTQRFDLPHRRSAADPGTCYLALSLEGVLLERVVRDFARPTYSLSALAARHALVEVRPARDLVLVDLVATPTTVYGVQAAEITAPPRTDAAPGMPPHPVTQALAARWAADAPADVDGILYSSRFGSRWLCAALWDRARDALVWGASAALTDDPVALDAACEALGLGLAP